MKKIIMFIALALSISGIARAADAYSVDKAHSSVGFSIVHMMVSKVNGVFNDYASTIRFDPADLAGSKFDFVIKVETIDTNNDARDKHLRSADFFEAEKYPDIVFTTREVVLKEGSNYDVVGSLTMKGVTKEITIPISVMGPVVNPMSGKPALGVEAHFQVDRQEYGVSWNKTLDNGGFLIGNKVDVNVFLEAYKD